MKLEIFQFDNDTVDYGTPSWFIFSSIERNDKIDWVFEVCNSNKFH